MASVDLSTASLRSCDCLTCIKCTIVESSTTLKHSQHLVDLAFNLKERVEEGECIDSQLGSRSWVATDFQMPRSRRILEMEDSLKLRGESVEKSDTISAEPIGPGVWKEYRKDGSRFVEKMRVKPREALLHYELHEWLSKDEELKEMVPRPLRVGFCEPGLVNVSMEYIDCWSLHDAWDNVEERETRDTLIVVHHLLSRAYKETGFTHGDLSTGNIVLRMNEDREEKRTWQVPGDGEVAVLTLPFVPTLIDFEYSSSRSRSYFDAFSSPYRNEGADIVRLYGLLLRYFDNTQGPLKAVKDHLAPLLGENWFGKIEHEQLIPAPAPFLHPSLTHEALIRVLLAC
jgi:hypothetical protein